MSIYSRKKIGKGKLEEISKIIKRTGSCCAFCGRQCYLDKMPLATVEHVIPLSSGGSDNLDNKRIACVSCNYMKSCLSIDEFKKELISLSCAVIKKEKKMENMERESYMYGARMGAEYMKSIGKTDLALLTPDEALTFSECMCKNYHLKYAELTSKLSHTN